MRADFAMDIGQKTFASGVLPELIAAARRCQTRRIGRSYRRRRKCHPRVPRCKRVASRTDPSRRVDFGRDTQESLGDLAALRAQTPMTAFLPPNVIRTFVSVPMDAWSSIPKAT